MDEEITKKLEYLERKWDNFSETFGTFYEPSTRLTANSIFTFFQISKAKKVLEVGCGAGGAAFLAAQLLAPDASLICLDLSPKMVEITKQKLSTTKISHQVLQGDAAVLPFEDNQFDRLYSNYCLHLIPNPDTALKEHYRVVSNGGIAAWSVWGRPENSPKYTIPTKAKVAIGEPDALIPSFHLCDLEATKTRVQNAGFKNVFAWYQFEVSECHDAKSFVETTIQGAPETKEYFSKLSPEKQQKFVQVLTDESNKFLLNGQPLGVEALILVGFVEK